MLYGMLTVPPAGIGAGGTRPREAALVERDLQARGLHEQIGQLLGGGADAHLRQPLLDLGEHLLAPDKRCDLPWQIVGQRSERRKRRECLGQARRNELPDML